MQRIRLKRGEWEYDPGSRIGKRGGFGQVFRGRRHPHEAVAIKKLHLEASEAAHRELRIADELLQRHLNHVVPVLDDGQDAETDSYYVVMALADGSLQDEINQRGSFSDKEAIRILTEIASGLSEVKDIVHRDLKPDNVLLHDGKWKVADFGIARFVEESTSLATLKDCWTPAYAAPEQWLLERASNATDIYALGCIAHALLTGAPPFRGPSYKEQHLTVEPPPLKAENNRLRTLISMMLRKPPDARPNVDRVIGILQQLSSEKATRAHSDGFQALAKVGAAAQEESARAAADLVARDAHRKRRAESARHAFQILRQIIEEFYQRIRDAVLDVERIDHRSQLELLHITLGRAVLQVEMLQHGQPIPEVAFSRSHWDVIAGATIQVLQSGTRGYSYKWGANLFYTNLGQGEEFRWSEVCFMWLVNPGGDRDLSEPFALDDLSRADIALGPGMSAIAPAMKPRPIDDENVEDFYERWAKLFAQAYEGRLQRPGRLPLD